MTGKEWEGFAVHAAPSAIEYELKLARKKAHEATMHVYRLELLQDKRQAQVDAGEWPPSYAGVRA